MSDEIPDSEVPERAKRPRSYSARHKAEILAEYETLDRQGKGALLRRKGLYTSLLRSGASSVTGARCRRLPSLWGSETGIRTADGVAILPPAIA
jgi:hypothetical protein